MQWVKAEIATVPGSEPSTLGLQCGRSTTELMPLTDTAGAADGTSKLKCGRIHGTLAEIAEMSCRYFVKTPTHDAARHSRYALKYRKGNATKDTTVYRWCAFKFKLYQPASGVKLWKWDWGCKLMLEDISCLTRALLGTETVPYRVFAITLKPRKHRHQTCCRFLYINFIYSDNQIFWWKN